MSVLTPAGSFFHPSRLLKLQEPVEIEAATPKPVHRIVSGSNAEVLGARQAQGHGAYFTGDSTGRPEATLSSSSSDQSGPPMIGSQFTYDNIRSGGSMFNQRPLPDRAARLFQCLFHSNDPDLLEYLSRRHISVRFLHEIDQLLRNNPELYRYSPEWANYFNSCRPLDAYKFFLKGYTKPARYIDGYLPHVQLFTIPQCYIPARLDITFDEELVEFFEGVPYRHDILQEIDRIVDALCYQIQCGMFVKFADRKLVAYALWGNPIDAYKYFEYNYQTTWLKHRYLPEHIELDKVPKGIDYTLPVPSVMGSDEGHRSHRMTRLRMARAQDNGVDVLDVLIREFVHELALKGHRRDHIERMKRKAQQALDEERNDPQGHDIVDMVMEMADSQPRVQKPVHNNAAAPTLTVHGYGPPVRYTMTRGGLFTIPGDGFLDADTVSQFHEDANIQIKIEPQTPLIQEKKQKKADKPQQHNAQPVQQTAEMMEMLNQRKKAYMASRTRLRNNLAAGNPKDQQAVRDRIAAGREFASRILSLNKRTKQLNAKSVDYLRKMAVVGYETQPNLHGLLSRFGNLIA
ncbi:uncharacterized protein BKCO1_2200043 [Diplodia corticola]|uniref:Uncharacterized protein n=1 Tax=Diplodia corticola TaxID=236234 RepID=A0A1J9R2Z0_9PEZI|nr:uncharacterized protein BKCO1_2200043 [Diplodia corticola]OJD34594.1 hypothetical protein BKCO1_2200043 [Diplodia corticola]